MFRNIVLGAAASVAALTLATGAYAADLPAYEPAPQVAAPVPSFSWTGGYVGVQAGYSWGDTSRLGRVKPKGGVVGAYAGYNYQFEGSPAVIGLETDFNYADIDDRAGVGKAETNWNGATRARVGAAFGRFLAYGAGGVAYADRKLKIPGDSDKKTAVGWTAGGGVEYAATDNVVARVDYRYADYGKDKFSLGGAVGKTGYTEHRVMGGVAYKFSGW